MSMIDNITPSIFACSGSRQLHGLMRPCVFMFMVAMVVTLACSLGCSAGDEERAASEDVAPQASAQAPKSHLVFEGVVYPENATKLRAPQNSFRINGWQSNSSWIKLQHVAKDGKEVKLSLIHI